MPLSERISDKALASLKNFLYRGRPPIRERKQKARGLLALPDISQFRAALTDAYHQAAASQTELAVVFLQTRRCPAARQEEIARFLLTMPGKNKTIFLPSESCFALILPGMGSERAAVFSRQVLDRLCVHFPGTPLNLGVVAYPKDATTLAQFEAELSCAVCPGLEGIEEKPFFVRYILPLEQEVFV